MPIGLFRLHVDGCAIPPGILPPRANFTPAPSTCRPLEYGLEKDRRGMATTAISFDRNLELKRQKQISEAAVSSPLKEVLP